MGLLTALDSALTTKPARIVLWAVSPLLRLERCRHFQLLAKAKQMSHVSVVVHSHGRGSLDAVSARYTVYTQVEGGRCKPLSRQTTDSIDTEARSQHRAV